MGDKLIDYMHIRMKTKEGKEYLKYWAKFGGDSANAIAKIVILIVGRILTVGDLVLSRITTEIVLCVI